MAGLRGVGYAPTSQRLYLLYLVKRRSGLRLAARTIHQEGRQIRRTENEEARILAFLERFPEYGKTLSLASLYEENLRAPSQGWRWHDVETHPTKLIRLVTDGIARVSVKTRGATYYLLRDREAVKKIVERSTGPADSIE
ncbi:MAG TPA: hypothetical protein VGS11_04415 [Candidatus Bathyarchaeia archaeon]|nr:hypothetical protein [Candidatus Bathyarchaeia archaeon]